MDETKQMESVEDCKLGLGGFGDFTRLPEEVWVIVLSYLDAVGLSVCEMLNKTWRKAFSCLWRELFFLQWSIEHEDVQMVSQGGWREIFLRKHYLFQNWSTGRFHSMVLEGHTRGIVCLQVTYSGRVVSGGFDCSVRMWEHDLCKSVMKGHTSWIRCLQADDFKAVSGASDRSIRVWNLSSASSKLHLNAHNGPVTGLQYNGSKLVSVSADSTAKLWDLHDGECLFSLLGHGGPISSLQFDSLSNLIYTGSMDRDVKIWDSHNGEIVATLSGHNTRVDLVHLLNDGKVATASQFDDIVRLWDLRTLSSNGSTLPIIGFNVNTKSAIWNTSNEMEYVHSGCGISALSSVVPYGSMQEELFVGGTQGQLLGWNVSSGAMQSCLEGHTSNVCIQADDRKLVSGSKDKTIRVWDIRTGKMLSRIPVDSPITCLSYRRNTLAVGTQESSIWIHDFQVPLSERELEDNASDCFPHGPPIDTCLNTRAGRRRLSSFFQNSIARIRPISTSVRVGS